MQIPIYSNSVNSIYYIWLVFWDPVYFMYLSLNDTSQLEGYISSISFCVLF